MSDAETWTPEEIVDPQNVDKQRLSFEHALRVHTNNASDALDRFAQNIGSPNARFEIRYVASDGGSWKISTWSFGSETISTSAAELFSAVNNIIIAVSNLQHTKTLRAQLTYESEENNGERT